MGRIFTCGDTHGGSVGDMKKLNSKNFPVGNTLTKEDYLIQLGDFGCVWHHPSSKESKKDKYWQKWLHEKSWTTLFVDGNHENHDMLAELEQVPMFGDIVGKVNDSIFHLKRGRIYVIHGKSFFIMGGAVSIDKENRTRGISWWSEEVPSYAEMDVGLENLETYNWDVDYVCTHTCPEYVSKMYLSVHNAQGWYADKVNDPTTSFLEHLRANLKFKHWYFGHWHDDWTWDNFTLQYNKVLEIPFTK